MTKGFKNWLNRLHSSFPLIIKIRYKEKRFPLFLSIAELEVLVHEINTEFYNAVEATTEQKFNLVF